MNKDIKIVRLHGASVTDIRAMATRFGRAVDHGDYGKVLSVSVVVENPDGEMTIMGWGETDRTRLIGNLFTAASHLTGTT